MTDELGWPSQFVLVRHGQSAAQASRINHNRPYSGDENPPLSPVGKRQAAALGQSWRGTPAPDVVLATTLDRARQTARIAVENTGWPLPVRVLMGAEEQSYGVLAHLSDEEIKQRDPEAYRLKNQQGFWHFRPDGGENWEDVARRMERAVTYVRRTYPGKRVLFFGHSCSNEVLRMLLEGRSIRDTVSFDIGRSFNCGVTTYRRSGNGMTLVSEFYRPPALVAVS